MTHPSQMDDPTPECMKAPDTVLQTADYFRPRFSQNSLADIRRERVGAFSHIQIFLYVCWTSCLKPSVSLRGRQGSWTSAAAASVVSQSSDPPAAELTAGSPFHTPVCSRSHDAQIPASRSAFRSSSVAQNVLLPPACEICCG